MTLPGRHVNPKVLQYVTWPQYKYGCSLASLTCVVNYLYAEQIGVQTPQAVATAIGMIADKIGWDGGPSNKTLIRWFERFLKAKNLQGKGSIEFTRRDVEDFDNNNSVCERFNAIAGNENQIMVLGESNHFLMITGYFDAADAPNRVYESSELRWIILADHWPGDVLERIPTKLRQCARQAMDMLAHQGLDLQPSLINTPIRCRRWRDMRQDMIHRGHKILVFGK